MSVSTLRYISLFSSFLVALSAGSNYGFSSYSPQLQERLHLTSTQINIVGVMGNMGVYLSGPFWGRLVDKKGPKVALALGAILVAVGYGGLSVSYGGTIWSSTSLPTLCMFSLFSGLGNSGAFTAAMNAQAKSWKEERRGLCTALVLSGFGLSAFFYSTLSHTLFPGKTGDYLLLLAFGSSFSFLIGLTFIRILPPDLDNSLLPSDAGQAGEASGSRKDEPTAASIDKTGRKLLKDPDFLILFFIMTIISGTGLLVINNIGTMTRTLYEYNKRQKGDVQQLQAHQVSAISIGNALGRILMGLMSDLVVNRTGDARYRVFLLLVVCTLALLSQGAAAWPNIISDLKKLFGMSIVTGLMYGTLFGLCPVLTFEWFGLRHFSQNWGIISLSPVIAGNTFNLLFGKIYDSHVPKDGHSHFCPDGEECFRSVFRFTAIGAVLATILSAIIIGRKAGWRKPSTARNEDGQGE
ncbi:MFS general substrate transporter [Meira miltonrushii]|uniref:MFS general substrate transporter n=1 Tax=Meira miltonrushii TaxID=1280837 RepID=A0A316V5D9_9BASI|nr:MFS general substrate transporter [Meira miltonrushii]PWN32787.1 MFS general substrate transporter [Meira miltonrushii]